MANRLTAEKSPYLLQHKDNPVNWYPWSREAFEEAAAKDKPIFLSIGYSTCHWCHVMAHESFETDEIARLLEDYVCIKVDREERPDIDAVYMAVCQALTGSGGWPLTIFMTPEQKPFFAGTYFPKNSRFGQPGLTDLLRRISSLWHTERDKLLASGDAVTAALNHSASPSSEEPEPFFLHQAYGLLSQIFDRRWGGFGSAPKFPSPHNLLFLMRLYNAESMPQALQMAETTLTAMARGGIFDHIGGGFSRYSTDEKWLIPHFEKMLYDNALLLLAYLEMYQIRSDSFYAHIARQTAEYILEELSHPSGGFYCGQDADSDGIEGKYYIWTPDESIRILGEADGMEFNRIYGITDHANFEGGSIPNRIGMDSPSWSFDDPRLKRLRSYRKERTSLHTDRKILLSWNAWTMTALAKAGLILHENRYIRAALKTRDFILTKMTGANNRLFLRYCDGEAAHAGQLEDYAVYALALIELYRTTFAVEYLKEAVLRARQMLDWFEDKKDGGFYLTAHDGEPLIVRPKETYDGALPSGNSVAQMVLEDLAHLTGDLSFREAADRQHRFMAGQVRQSPGAHCFSLMAMMKSLYPHRELICTASKLPSDILAYLEHHPAPDLSILFKSGENAAELARTAPFTHSYPISEAPVWYLCEKGSCRSPQTDFPDLSLS